MLALCVCVLHTEIEEKSMRAVTRRLERVLSMQLKKAVACLHAAAQTKLTRDEKRAVKERPISVDRRSHSVEGRIMQQRIRIKQGAKWNKSNFESLQQWESVQKKKEL